MQNLLKVALGLFFSDEELSSIRKEKVLNVGVSKIATQEHELLDMGIIKEKLYSIDEQSFSINPTPGHFKHISIEDYSKESSDRFRLITSIFTNPSYYDVTNYLRG
ncbi:MAG: hypothetical protein ACTSXQ_03165 [Alphaproteobacteria bacterium]